MAFIPAIFAAVGSVAGAAGGLGSIGSILGLVGTGLSVVGSLQSANAEASAAKYDAALKNVQAKTAQDQAASRSAEVDRRAKQQKASMIAQGANSGFDVTTGSLASAIDYTGDLGHLDAMTEIYNGQVAATGMHNEANLDLRRAKDAKKAGWLGAASKAVSGLAGVYRDANGGSLAN